MDISCIFCGSKNVEVDGCRNSADELVCAFVNCLDCNKSNYERFDI